jgi:hypothetical protein
MRKIHSDKIRNGVIELYQTKNGYCVKRWIYYDKSKNTEMYLQSKRSFSKDDEEFAFDLFYETVIEEGGEK